MRHAKYISTTAKAQKFLSFFMNPPHIDIHTHTRQKSTKRIECPSTSSCQALHSTYTHTYREWNRVVGRGKDRESTLTWKVKVLQPTHSLSPFLYVFCICAFRPWYKLLVSAATKHKNAWNNKINGASNNNNSSGRTEKQKSWTTILKIV